MIILQRKTSSDQQEGEKHCSLSHIPCVHVTIKEKIVTEKNYLYLLDFLWDLLDDDTKQYKKTQIIKSSGKSN